jgi:nucleotide-binding universal stress UspA family protein
MGPVIVGYDGSNGASDALILGASIAALRDCKLSAVYFSSQDQRYTMINPDDQAIMRTRLYDLRERAHRLVSEAFRGDSAPFLEVRILYAPSAPQGLHDLAEYEHSSALVVGSPCGGPLWRATVGSTAARLFVKAPCPVLVAPWGYARNGSRNLRKVGVALDGREDSAGALAEAAALADDAKASLVALNVTRDGARERIDLDRVLDTMAGGSAGQVERARLGGRPARSLARASQALDLLVVGCRAQRGFRSVSRRLVTSTASPLMVVPEDMPRADGAR